MGCMHKTNFYLKIIVACLLLIPEGLSAQKLKPGFDKAEYIEMLKIAQKQHVDISKWATDTKVPAPASHKLVYRSPVMGLENMWDLWMGNDGVAVISVRGTTGNTVSWLANFYSAMVPATGTLELEKDFSFKYKLCNEPKAAVHVGWLLAMAYLSRDIMPHIDSCYKQGIKDFIITGHSQGGAITYLLTSYLESRKKDGRLPGDIRFKTYSSAAPKPGNLYYAYEYENMTRNGWGYNVVNTADWVPETPVSVQTIGDFNNVNPFTNAKKTIRKQKFPTRLALMYAFNRLDKPTKRSQKHFEKYMGRMMAKNVKKNLPQYKAGKYFTSVNYVRTGTTIILYADEVYHKAFPDDQKQIFMHHFCQPYLYLAEKLK